MNKFERLYKRAVHRLIVKYLVRCGGAFHHGEYGDEGKYIKLFTDKEYGEYQTLLIKFK